MHSSHLSFLLFLLLLPSLPLARRVWAHACLASGDLDLAVQLRIFENLSARDLVRAAGTCREWRDIASQDVLWRSVLRRSPTLLIPPDELTASSSRYATAKEQFFVNEGWRTGAFLRRRRSRRKEASSSTPPPYVEVAFTRDANALAAVDVDGYVSFVAADTSSSVGADDVDLMTLQRDNDDDDGGGGGGGARVEVEVEVEVGARDEGRR